MTQENRLFRSRALWDILWAQTQWSLSLQFEEEKRESIKKHSSQGRDPRGGENHVIRVNNLVILHLSHMIKHSDWF